MQVYADVPSAILLIGQGKRIRAEDANPSRCSLGPSPPPSGQIIKTENSQRREWTGDIGTAEKRHAWMQKQLKKKVIMLAKYRLRLRLARHSAGSLYPNSTYVGWLFLVDFPHPQILPPATIPHPYLLPSLLSCYPRPCSIYSTTSTHNFLFVLSLFSCFV